MEFAALAKIYKKIAGIDVVSNFICSRVVWWMQKEIRKIVGEKESRRMKLVLFIRYFVRFPHSHSSEKGENVLFFIGYFNISTLFYTTQCWLQCQKSGRDIVYREK